MSSSSKFIFFVVLGLLCGSVPARAQLVPNRTYTQADGLPSDYVTHISQDHRGRMWFATEKGVAIYDGDSFRTLTVRDGLPANFVYAVEHRPDGGAWIATAGSDLPVFWDGNRIHPFPVVKSLGIHMGQMFTDRHGRLFLSNRYHLLVWDGQRLDHVAQNVDLGDFKPMGPDRQVSCGAFGCLVLDTSSPDTVLIKPLQVVGRVVDPKAYSIYSALITLPDGRSQLVMNTEIVSGRLRGDTLVVENTFPFTTMTLRHELVGQNGNRIWLMGSRHQGLLRWNPDTGRSEPIRLHHRSDRSLISAIFQDYEGTVWVSSFGTGVVKIPEWGARLYDHSFGVQDPRIWRFGMDDGRLVAALRDGIYRLDAQTERFERLRTGDQPRGYLSRGNDTWVAYFPFVQHYDRRSGTRTEFPSGDGVNDLEWAPDGSVWVATAGRHQLRMTPTRADTLHFAGLPALFGVEDLVRIGTAMWMLTNDRGAIRIQADAVTHYPVGDVRSVAETPGEILLGTTEGLVVVRNGQIRRLGEREGLIGSSVIGLFPTTDGTGVWVITRRQVHAYRNGVLTRHRSLLPLRPYFNTASRLHLDPDGFTLHVASAYGWLQYDLRTQAGTIPPPRVSIASVRVDTTDFDPRVGALSHTAAAATLEFRFLGTSFIDEDGVRIRYRLEGADPDWADIARGTPVRYAQLPPGTYTLLVKAINADGIESAEMARFEVRIVPPFWMTSWFRLFLLVMASGMAFGLIRWRIAHVREDVQRKGRQRQFEAIQRIGAGIAHDMKNTVFSLSLLAKNLEKRFDQPEFRRDAIETLESSLGYLSRLIERFQTQRDTHELRLKEADLADTIRMALDRVRLAETPGIEIRLELEYGRRVRHDPHALARVVENLAVNAVEAMANSGVLSVAALVDQNEILVTIEDTGPGMPAEFIRKKLFQPFHTTKTKGLGLGLYTSRELVAAMGGRMEVASEPGKGTRFRIRLPILEA